jgi:hypothetical protein
VRKLRVLEKKRRQILGVVGTAIGTDQVWLKKKNRQSHRRFGTALETMVQRAAHDRQVTLMERQRAVLNLQTGSPPAQIRQLEVFVTILADVVPQPTR